VKKIFSTITLRDFLMVFGLGLFGFGLYLFIPWVSFAITGAVIMAAGFFIKE
jgi:hypothetical protein